jgi:hypothetical protein
LRVRSYLWMLLYSLYLYTYFYKYLNQNWLLNSIERYEYDPFVEEEPSLDFYKRFIKFYKYDIFYYKDYCYLKIKKAYNKNIFLVFVIKFVNIFYFIKFKKDTVKSLKLFYFFEFLFFQINIQSKFFF